MDEHQVQDKIFELIKLQLGLKQGEPIDNSTQLDGLKMDSLDEIEFIMLIEENFDIEVSDDDYVGIKTLGDIIDIVSRAIK